MAIEDPDDETAGMLERIVILRVSTKHINLWMRKLEMKKDGDERACWHCGVGRSQKIETEKNLEIWV